MCFTLAREMLDTSYLIYHTQNEPPSIESCENLQSVPRTSQRGRSKPSTNANLPQTDILRGLILLCTVAYCFGSPRISISPHDWNMPQSDSFKFNMFWRGRGAYLWVTVSRERPHETPQGREAEKHTFLGFNSTWIHSSPASFFVLVLSHVLKTRYTVTGCTFTFLTSKTGESGRFGPNLDMDNFMNEECYETISPSNVS